MKEFLGKDFLIDNEIGQVLFDKHAKDMPIFDFHCHLVPQEIYEDKKFKNITEAWLGANHYGDHYKWRLLREIGVPEEYITGDKPDKERFMKFAESMPYFVGNPIYEWTHLELRRYFGINKTLSPETADEIYEECNKKLETLTARKMIAMNKVDTLFTTDDPIDDLHFHELLAADKTFKTNVLPCMRPDKAINIDWDTFLPWIGKLADVCGREIATLEDMLSCLDSRIEYFVKHGCRATDHALDVLKVKKCTFETASNIFAKALKGTKLSQEEVESYKFYLLIHLGQQYSKYNLIQEYHIGALRNNSTRRYQELGPDTGFDATNDLSVSENLSLVLSTLDETNSLPKTILYTLNSKDYEPLVTLMNCYQGNSIRGKIQFGTSWWFNDHFDGINKQLRVLAADGLLSCFVGMLTDSRSLLSYPRHEYFRRLVCNQLGKLVEQGRYPNDMETLGKIVEDISFNNAKRYFED